MINIVNHETHYDDNRQITFVDIKLKHFKNGDELSKHQLVATASAAFYQTTFLTDSGWLLETKLDPERDDILDMAIKLNDSELTAIDVANFIDAFQKALDETSLF